MKTKIFPIVLSILGLGVFDAQADTHYVSLSGENSAPYTNWADAATSIQDAVEAAASNDTVLVTNGTYSSGGAEVYSMSNRVALTKAVTLQSVNGPDATFIVGAGDPVSTTNGPAAVRCAYLTNGAVIDGFTLANGYTHKSGDQSKARSGGGIWLDGGGTVTNCTISGNLADFNGGGVFCSNGGMLIGCTISDNRSGRRGGGGYCNAAGTFRNCTISSNASSVGGGGVCLVDGGTLSYCTINSNSLSFGTSQGGGVECSYGGTLNHCMLSGNSSHHQGGGVYCASAGTLINCVISGNSSGDDGGGVKCRFGGSLKHCTLSENFAGEEGGGVACVAGGAFTNCIVWGNTADVTNTANWDQRSFDEGSFAATCTTPTIGTDCVTNGPQFVGSGNVRLQFGSPCIDVGQTLAAITNDIEGTTRPLDGNDSGGAEYDIGAYEFELLPMVTITGPAGDILVYAETSEYSLDGTNNVWVVGSMVWTNAANGTNGILSISGFGFHVPSIPIEFGTNVISVWGTNKSGTVAFDSITITRNREYSEYGETSPTHYVSTSGTAVWPFTSWMTAAASIQDALEAAVSNDVVLVTNGVYNTDGAEAYSISNRVMLDKAVTLRSVNGPDVTSIVGAADPVSTNGLAAVRCAYLTNGAVLAGFTLTNGHTHASGDSIYRQSGGGFLLDGGGTLSNCTIRSGTADQGGAGVLNYGGTLDHCTVIDNSAAYGGGVHCYFGGTLSHCTFSRNVSSVRGGGVYCFEGGMLNNCRLSGNSASDAEGGGLYVYKDGTLNHCTLTANTAVGPGGGVYFHKGGTVNNSILWGNTAKGKVGNWGERFSGDGSFSNACTTPTIGINCVTNDPLFVDAGGGDFRLLSNSPCIDAGITLAWITDDIEGTPRPLDGNNSGTALPDIGAYEFSSAVSNTDGDPHSDYKEYIADTDPTDPNDYLHIAWVRAPMLTGVVYASSSRRQYTLWYTTNLVEGVWDTAPGLVDVRGSGGQDFLAPSDSLPVAFYRVEVELIE